jgi:hypothetical protein
MGLTERLGGEWWWWTLNLEVLEMGSVLMSLLGRMGWGYEGILRRVGGSFQVIPDLRWEMAPRLDYGMTYGVGTGPLRKPFKIYMVLLAQMMFLLRLSWSFLMLPFNGT